MSEIATLHEPFELPIGSTLVNTPNYAKNVSPLCFRVSHFAFAATILQSHMHGGGLQDTPSRCRESSFREGETHEGVPCLPGDIQCRVPFVTAYMQPQVLMGTTRSQRGGSRTHEGTAGIRELTEANQNKEGAQVCMRREEIQARGKVQEVSCDKQVPAQLLGMWHSVSELRFPYMLAALLRQSQGANTNRAAIPQVEGRENVSGDDSQEQPGICAMEGCCIQSGQLHLLAMQRERGKARSSSHPTLLHQSASSPVRWEWRNTLLALPRLNKRQGGQL